MDYNLDGLTEEQVSQVKGYIHWDADREGIEQLISSFRRLNTAKAPVKPRTSNPVAAPHNNGSPDDGQGMDYDPFYQ